MGGICVGRTPSKENSEKNEARKERLKLRTQDNHGIRESIPPSL
jgi:hypothetical protein